MSHIKVPAEGQKIVPGQAIPNNPIIPFIEGDGIGADITPVMKDVIDAAVAKAYGGAKKFIGWKCMRAKKPPKFTATTSGCLKKLWQP
uniref:isocitrate dehydrogenase (NADP(+)) n=1 Tax=Conchiformibius kuhniae TaxID=211502 RepID=A0A8T9MXE9_9NEIS|nr:hypothetical protein LVJ77_00450 [Conchiformibius kuhniae]